MRILIALLALLAPPILGAASPVEERPTGELQRTESADRVEAELRMALPLDLSREKAEKRLEAWGFAYVGESRKEDGIYLVVYRVQASSRFGSHCPSLSLWINFNLAGLTEFTFTGMK
jgi:hypothetical protein